MPTYRTPDIYIEEIPLFPPSIAEVETAIPVFIGHTRFAEYKGKSLSKKTVRITSLMEFHERFGQRPPAKIEKIVISDNNRVEKVHQEVSYNLYDSLQMFFLNGGGPCYIISIGDFSGEDSREITKVNYLGGLKIAAKEDEITILVLPDAVNLKESLYTVQQQALAQCNRLMDRFCILDIFEEEASTESWEKGCQDFRDKIGINYLKYGAAYTPCIIADIDKNVGYSLVKDVLYKGGDEEKDKVTIQSLTDNAMIIKLIQDVELAVTSMQKTAPVSYTQLPATSRLVNKIPNLSSLPKTDMEKYLSKIPGEKKDRTIQEHYNKVSSLDESNLDQLMAIIKDSLIGVVLNWCKPNLGIAPQIQQHIIDALIGWFESIEADYPADIVAIIKAWTADLEKPLNGTKIPDVEKLILILGDFGSQSDPKTKTKTKNEKKGKIDLLFSSYLNLLFSIYQASTRYYSNIHDSLCQQFPLYNDIIQVTAREIKTLPPSGAIAGIYASVDRDRGVWKAPANVSLSAVSDLTHKIDSATQESLNIDVTGGKSINAIRPFIGKGTLVWGARTLMGNDNEWRYISVRRFFNMVEESVKKSTYWAVFEPNDANLWMKVKASIEGYLHEKRMQGALAGATDEAAFEVNVGLNNTMTAQDILEGRLIIEIKMAVVRPAEFIIMRFMHKMQES